MKLLVIISVGFDITEQLLNRLRAFVRYWEYNENVHQPFIDFKEACDYVRREVLYNILIQFWILIKLVRLIKVCLSETYNKVHIGKCFSDSFLIQNGLKQGDAISPLLFNFS
jgi:hypothetical protein